MKKTTIWLLTIIMALTFCSLLYIQIMYMNNMIRMRDDQFAEGVRRALYSVSTSLEQDETRYFLEEDAAAMQASLYQREDGTGSLNYPFTTPEGLEANIIISSDKNTVPSLEQKPRYRQMPASTVRCKKQ